jgi:ketosteroid isomerase-like protein
MSQSDDRHAITALIHAYAERIDAGDLDGVATLLADAVWRSASRPDGIRGIEAIRAVYADTLLYDGVPSTQHVVTNVVVDVTGDVATARSRYTVLQARPEFPLQPIIAGRYHDAFARDVRGWHFTERTILVDLVGDLSHHLRRAPAPGR